MKWAIVNGIKTEAAKNIKGICPSCGSELIAKCGDRKINHWAHKGTSNCDPWWEPETEWHRSWKNNYSNEWQEVSLLDEKNGEKHIADVRTIHGLVIEFQHSHINPKERDSREKFYKNMIWVVDGTRLKRDYPRFRNEIKSFKRTTKKGFYFIDFPDKVFPADWINSSVPVIFDFRDTSVTKEQDVIRNILWCLLPIRIQNCYVVAGIEVKDLIKTTHCRRQLFTENEKQQRQTPPVIPTMRRESQYILERGRWIKRQRL